MAARRERGLFDPEAAAGDSLFDHDIYVIASDGDLEEGIASEASSLAGHQKLGNLTVLYDDNHISIEDDTNVAFSEDVAARYESYGWHVQKLDWTNGGTEYVEDVQALYDAFQAAAAVTDKPSFIQLRTIIAWPAPTKQNTGASHGSALGADEIAATKKLLGLRSRRVVRRRRRRPRAHASRPHARRPSCRRNWQNSFDAWKAEHADAAALLERLTSRTLPDGWDADLPTYEASDKGVATRVASGEFLTAAAPKLPGAVGRLGRPRRLQQHDPQG